MHFDPTFHELQTKNLVFLRMYLVLKVAEKMNQAN